MIRGLVLVAAVLAGIGALVGYLIGRSAAAAGWGMCVAGALWSLTVAGSGSPSQRLRGARAGPLLSWWGESAPLPESPFWMLASSLLVFAAGIAVIVLA